MLNLSSNTRFSNSFFLGGGGRGSAYGLLAATSEAVSSHRATVVNVVKLN